MIFGFRALVFAGWRGDEGHEEHGKSSLQGEPGWRCVDFHVDLASSNDSSGGAFGPFGCTAEEYPDRSTSVQVTRILHMVNTLMAGLFIFLLLLCVYNSIVGYVASFLCSDCIEYNSNGFPDALLSDCIHQHQQGIEYFANRESSVVLHTYWY